MTISLIQHLLRFVVWVAFAGHPQLTPADATRPAQPAAEANLGRATRVVRDATDRVITEISDPVGRLQSRVIAGRPELEEWLGHLLLAPVPPIL